MKGLLVLLAVEVALVLTSMICVLVLYPHGDSTMWSPGYSEEGFSDLKLGESKEKALHSAGPPLNSYHMSSMGKSALRASTGGDLALSPDTYWAYTAPGRSGSCAYYVRELIFDDNGRIVRKEAYFESE